MSEGVLGVDNSGPSCCLSIERQKTVLNVVFKGVHSGGVEGVSWSCTVKGLFLSCPGYFCTTVSFLSHLTVQICYAIMDIY